MLLKAKISASRRWLAILMALAIVAIACGGSSGPGTDFPKVTTLEDREIIPVIVNHVLAVGPNRFSLGLLDEEESPILGAKVHLRFFDLNGQKPVFKSEAEARFIPVELSLVDERSGKQKRIVGNSGVYVAPVNFDAAGLWGVEITVTLEGKKQEPIPFQFNVLEKSPEPGIGDPAPPSRQQILADVSDVTQIDSSFPPRPHMHNITIADAIAMGKPVVVAFATPAFCESFTCGPVMDTVMDPLYQKYKDQAIFIHVEPYFLKELREGLGRCPVPVFNLEFARRGLGEGPTPCPPLPADKLPPPNEDWRFSTEPWVFVIDKQGKIAGKFEGIVALDEVENLLQRLLAVP